MKCLAIPTWSIIFINLFCIISCQNKSTFSANYHTIPLAQSIEMRDGSPFEIKKSTVIVYQNGDKILQSTAKFLADYIYYATGLSLAVTDKDRAKDAIIIKANYPNANSEAYNITVNQNLVVINGSSENGTFYGIQTLRKSITADTENKTVLLPAAEITDYPRFAYRGMMLDVSRHFFPVDFVKKYIDILALHNLNRFHWHLSDDQGWRIEIKKWPRLTEIGSKRKETIVGILYDQPQRFDGEPHSGFYTQEEIKEVVAYAESRFITIIPEIDLPGHMLSALAAYPELGCTGGPYEVATKWGVFDDVLCVGNEKTFEFLEDVFSEIIGLFPSQYIHIGGDECPKTRWKVCPKCQARARLLGLKADNEHTVEEKLQSYCMSRVEKFLNSKGREIIGWDEILEGGIAPNATVMSWRGTEGGIEAARLKHDAIMAPHYNLYFDYYQAKDRSHEPLAIGGYIPLEKVYKYEPVPDVLNDQEKKYIIGVQANLWTEYIKTTDGVEYMVLPRIAALSEIQWTNPEKKDYVSFLSRLGRLFPFYDKSNYAAARHVYEVDAMIDTSRTRRSMLVSLITVGQAPIHYTLDGSPPTVDSKKYNDPIEISEDTELKAVAFHPGYTSKTYSRKFIFNKATLNDVQLLTQPNPKYTFSGGALLTDGARGSLDFNEGTWIGFSKDGMEAIVDMRDEKTIRSVSVGTLVDTPDWIFGPTEIIVEVSEDNKNFKSAGRNQFPVVSQDADLQTINISTVFEPIRARYVKVKVVNTRNIPEWHEGRGQRALLFVDEIEVD